MFIMKHELQAIYEHGVLRPLIPLDLPELSEVTLVLTCQGSDSEQAVIPSTTELAQQQMALNAMFAEVDSLPQTPRNDGLSNRDHDQILYGSES